MRQIWSDAEDITCIHPGWGPVTGREAVMRSWETILESPPQINCTEPSGYISGESAYVIAFENLGEGRLIATNVFRLEFDDWRMIHHQAGLPAPRPLPRTSTKRGCTEPAPTLRIIDEPTAWKRRQKASTPSLENI